MHWRDRLASLWRRIVHAAPIIMIMLAPLLTAAVRGAIIMAFA